MSHTLGCCHYIQTPLIFLNFLVRFLVPFFPPSFAECQRTLYVPFSDLCASFTMRLKHSDESGSRVSRSIYFMRWCTEVVWGWFPAVPSAWFLFVFPSPSNTWKRNTSVVKELKEETAWVTCFSFQHGRVFHPGYSKFNSWLHLILEFIWSGFDQHSEEILGVTEYLNGTVLWLVHYGEPNYAFSLYSVL